MIHVGKKCGAISKDADYGSVSISGLVEALKETPVYEEAMKVIFHDDFDVDGASKVVSKMKSGEIEVKLLEYEGLSPIARIGVEEISRRGEIVSPERLRALLRQSTRVRILDTFLVAVCTHCWEFLELRRVRDLETLKKCPSCGREAIGLSTDSYENVFSLAMKARSRSTFRGKRLKLLTSLKRSAELRKEYGHTLDMLLAGRGIRLSDASNLASRMKKEGEAGGEVIDQIIEGEREALRRRYFASTGQ